jgi:hypothetical protein
MPLTADVTEISRSGHGVQTLTLDAGSARAGQSYVMLGSLSGTTPGFERSGISVSLNPDLYMLVLLRHPDLSPVQPARGTLDVNGRATATFALERRWNAAAVVGRTFHHAYVLWDRDCRITFASNSVPVTIVP